MTDLHIAGTLGCILAATHIAISFPVYVRYAANLAVPRRQQLGHLWSGLALFTCWAVYAWLDVNPLLGFAQALGILKFTAALLQTALHRRMKT